VGEVLVVLRFCRSADALNCRLSVCLPKTLRVCRELGLKLEPSKGTVETLVIERAEKPSANLIQRCYKSVGFHSPNSYRPPRLAIMANNAEVAVGGR
jgi:hypothetical protein